MSSFSEQDSIDPDNPELDYTPLRLSERAAKLGPLVSQGARSEPIRSSPMLLPALLAPEPIGEPARRTPRPNRRTALLSVATVVAGAVTVAALLLVTMKPAFRPSVTSPIPSEITGSTPQSVRVELDTTPVTSSLKQPDDQSQELLQRLLQWREEANRIPAVTQRGPSHCFLAERISGDF